MCSSVCQQKVETILKSDYVGRSENLPQLVIEINEKLPKCHTLSLRELARFIFILNRKKVIHVETKGRLYKFGAL